MSQDASEECTCPGREQGAHDLACEHALRRVFGSVEAAPPEARALAEKRQQHPEGNKP